MSDLPELLSEPEVLATIRGIAVGGSAVGRVTGPEGSSLVGMTAFVPFAAPGETVRVGVRQQYPRYLEGELLSVVEPSPDRVTPRCSYFGTCGGCDLQHLAYEAQITAKQDMVQSAFKTGGLGELIPQIAPIVSGPEYAYRRRITLHVGPDGSLSYFRRRSHTLLPVAECPIAVPEIDRFLASGFRFTGFEPDAVSKPVGDMSIEAGENGLFGVLRLPESLPVDLDATDLLDQLRTVFVGGALVVGGSTLARFGEESVLRRAEGGAALEATDDAVEGPARATPGVFSQVNAAVNEKLIAAVTAAAVANNVKTAYDLYAGAGNFALPLAARDISVTAVESVNVLVASGREEATRLGLAERVRFTEGTVERFLRSRPKPRDLIIADPPRTGLGKLAPYFTFAHQMALISCDLPSAIRDIKALRQSGWTVENITPFDMFAQTTHVELLIVLRR